MRRRANKKRSRRLFTKTALRRNGRNGVRAKRGGYRI